MFDYSLDEYLSQMTFREMLTNFLVLDTIFKRLKKLFKYLRF